MTTRACKQCGHVGLPARHTPGSIGIEIVLWLCFLVPGLIYSLWRINARVDVCAACSSRDLVPINSPVGQHLLAQLPKPAREAAAAPPAPSGAAVAVGRALGTIVRKLRGK